MSLGSNILKERKKLKLSQEQLAEKIEVTRQTISNWELDVTAPTPDQLKTISKIFDKSIDELLDNITDLIIQKTENTENLIKKQIKFSKTVIITIYSLMLIALIGYTVYKFNKKDYTGTYQSSFECYTSDKEVSTISITEKDGHYIIDADGNEYLAGDSISEAFTSLNLVKRTFIERGRICK